MLDMDHLTMHKTKKMHMDTLKLSFGIRYKNVEEP